MEIESRVIIQNICKIDNEEEIALMLDFYHKRREIVKHNETVVLQARWLINVFKQLITIRSFNDMVRNNDLIICDS